MLWYEPYQKQYPAKQTRLLQLFDLLGIPHEEPKQEWGSSLVIIGFSFDPNAMTITLPPSSRLELITALRQFAQPGTRRPLRDFERLAGWSQWSFNVAPLLRPGLSHMYDKMAGKSEVFQLMWVSVALCRELLWMAERLEASDGVLLLDSLEWSTLDADLVLYTDASAAGMGIWCPSLHRGLHSLIDKPEPSRIFFYEVLAVVSALTFAASFNHFHRIVIFTDNLNTVSMFNSLHAKPDYNPLLITAMNTLLDNNLQLRVLHIPGSENVIADAISRSNFDIVASKHPESTLHIFSPPELSSGSKSI
ncbi:hypothetical protein D9758_015628 [Tetrapyrgos nigripes]|uniref:Uncharacterized protein n=1 Tax=Tetrapyrgos nigripes TaxID=182062 RepID=A0A8H5FNK8_9AGAR|nr:hypothetical protein D9758_015628 [Tetrapyrgos nigripes]